MNQHIFEIKKRDAPYVILDKGFLNNPHLTMQAKGLLAYLLSLPKDWKIYRSELVKRFANGEKALRNTIVELIENGYIMRYQSKNEKSRFGNMIYRVFETPELKNESAEPFPPHEKPCAGKAHGGLTRGGKRPLLTNNELKKKELISQSTTIIALKKELEDLGWVGDVTALADKAGGGDAALYFWQKLKPLLEHVSPSCRGGFISNRFASEAKQIYAEYLDQNERDKKEKLEEERRLGKIAEKAATGNAEKENLLKQAESIWGSLSLSNRMKIVKEYCQKNDFTENIFKRGFDPLAGKLLDEFAESLIWAEISENLDKYIT